MVLYWNAIRFGGWLFFSLFGVVTVPHFIGVSSLENTKSAPLSRKIQKSAVESQKKNEERTIFLCSVELLSRELFSKHFYKVKKNWQ